MKWIIRALLLLLTLVVIGVVSLAIIPGKKLAEFVEIQLEAATGREVTIFGDVTTKVFPQLKVITGPVKIANAEWAAAEPMIKANGLSLGVKLLPLLRGVFEIGSVTFLSPDIRLESSNSGERNWDFSEVLPLRSADLSNGRKTKEKIDQLNVFNGKVLFTDHISGANKTVRNVNLSAKFPIGERGIGFSLSGSFEDRKFKTTAVIDDPWNFVLGGVSRVDIDGIYNNTRTKFRGKFGLRGPVLDGEVETSIINGSWQKKVLGLESLPISKPISVAGKITRTSDGSAFLRAGKVIVEGQKLRGSFDVTRGDERPHLRAVLNAQDLVLSRLQRQERGLGSESWSANSLNFSDLYLMDAEVSLSAESLGLGGLQLGKVQILMKLNNGRAVYHFNKLNLYNGLVSGQFVVNGRGGFSVGGAFDFENVQIQKLFGAVVGVEPLAGAANLRFEFLGLGRSLDEILKSLSGSGKLSMKEGSIKRVRLIDDIVGADDRSKEVEFESVEAAFVVQDGVITGDGFTIENRKIIARGRGKIDVGNRTLSYRFDTHARGGVDHETAQLGAIVIEGPWSKLEFIDERSKAPEPEDAKNDVIFEN